MVHAPTALGLFARGAAASSKLCSRWYLFPLSNTCRSMCSDRAHCNLLQQTDLYSVTNKRVAWHSVWVLRAKCPDAAGHRIGNQIPGTSADGGGAQLRMCTTAEGITSAKYGSWGLKACAPYAPRPTAAAPDNPATLCQMNALIVGGNRRPEQPIFRVHSQGHTTACLTQGEKP